MEMNGIKPRSRIASTACSPSKRFAARLEVRFAIRLIDMGGQAADFTDLARAHLPAGFQKRFAQQIGASQRRVAPEVIFVPRLTPEILQTRTIPWTRSAYRKEGARGIEAEPSPASLPAAAGEARPRRRRRSAGMRHATCAVRASPREIRNPARAAMRPPGTAHLHGVPRRPCARVTASHRRLHRTCNWPPARTTAAALPRSTVRRSPTISAASSGLAMSSR